MKYIQKDLKFIVLISANFLLSIVSVLFPLALMKVTDFLIANEMNLFRFYLFLALIIIVIQMAMTYVTGRMNNTYVMHRTIEIRNRVMKALLQSEYGQFKSQKNDEYASLLLTNIPVLENDYFKTVINLISKSLLLVVSICTLIVLNPLLTLSLIIVIAVLGIFPLLFTKRILLLKEELIKKTEEYTKSTSEALYGYETIKIYKVANYILNRHVIKIKKMERKSKQFGDILILANVTFGSSSMVLLLLIFLIGGYSVSTGALTVGSLIACTQLIMYVFEPAISITQDLNIVRSTKPIRQQIDKIIERSEDGEENNKVFIDQFEKIHLENISYVYPDEEKAAVRQVSITLEAGKKYAIVGGNGSGKSTLLKMIAGLITDYTGSIRLDNRDMKQVSYENLAYIDQQTYLFNTTIRENILMGQSDVSSDFEELQSLIERLQLRECINKHPDQLDFVVGDHGEYLSGGERQKVCIARALYKRPEILLLDEPDSALDPETRDQIKDILGQMKDVLCLMITHEYDESLKGFDEIIVMEQGEIIRTGRYEEVLMKHETTYKAFV
ncbi:ABC transporter ATP-binding protein [Paenibacillus sp. FSL K6-1318]|uniref:ABC transporter ATP-binding protein n=1 Tax=Paenibacillus sp. FSL K6-1318 TaxID=2975291 RepID=UPI0030EF0D59